MHGPPAHYQPLPPKAISVCLSVQSRCKLQLTLWIPQAELKRSRGGNGPVALLHVQCSAPVWSYVRGRLALQAFPDFPY